MSKVCEECQETISNTSKQTSNQIYCTARCRKRNHRRRTRSTAISVRFKQREGNLLLNDEMRYVIAQCRYAGTVQILSGHDRKSYPKTMTLIRERPSGHVQLCHIAPVKGYNFIGLLHHKNLFYGGDHQNNKFRNKYGGGGVYILHSELKDKWTVCHDNSGKEILALIKKFLGRILDNYIKTCPIRKSKRYQLAKKISDVHGNITIEELLNFKHNELCELWTKMTRQRIYKSSKGNESKFLAYIDSLTRFIKDKHENTETLKRLRRIMIISYMALERVEASETYNRDFYIKYERLIQEKYSQAMLKNPNEWSVFKDLVYKAAFETLQGIVIKISIFRKEVMSHLHFPPKAWRVMASPWQYKMIYQQTING